MHTNVTHTPQHAYPEHEPASPAKVLLTNTAFHLQEVRDQAQGRQRPPEPPRPLLNMACYLAVLPQTAYAVCTTLFLLPTERQFSEQWPFPDGSYLAPCFQIFTTLLPLTCRRDRAKRAAALLPSGGICLLSKFLTASVKFVPRDAPCCSSCSASIPR